MHSRTNDLASLAQASERFNATGAAADMHRLLSLWDYGLMLVGGVLVLSFFAAGLADRRRALAAFAPQRRCHLGPQALFLPVMVYLLAVVLLHPLIAWGMDAPAVAAADAPEATNEAADVVGVLSSNFAYVFGVLACYLVGRRAVGTVASPFVVGQRRYGRYLVDGVAGVLIAFALCQSMLYLTVRLIEAFRPRFSFPEHDVIDVLRDPSCPSWLQGVLWVGVVVVTPVAEEMFFRGLVQTALGRAMRSRILAVAAVGVLFGLAHSSQPQVIPALALFGVILGLLYERSGSLIGPIIAHALFNAKTLLWTSLGAT